MGINQAQHVLRPHDVIPGHGSSLKVEGELGGREGVGEGGGCVFRYVYNPSYPSTSITLVSYTAVLSVHKASAGSG